MEVAWWFLARKQSLGGETPAFPFPHSFVHGSADRLSSCAVENAGYGTLTIAVASVGPAKRSELLRDRLRTVTADRDTKIGVARSAFFRVGLSRQAQGKSAPEGVPHEASVSLDIVGNDGWGTHDRPPLTSRYYVRSIPPGF
jgi:hypothetical protein